MINTCNYLKFLIQNNIGGNNNSVIYNNNTDDTGNLTTTMMTNNNNISLPHYSNNKLKKWITYNDIRKDLEKQRKQFEIRNSLDMQLYEYVQNEIAS